ncbi:MAG: SAM-dependent methyltransferase [Sulfurimonas sp.]|nr:MAG: SAM-dependent methyltransferase [Sulfurimonas sp.]
MSKTANIESFQKYSKEYEEWFEKNDLLYQNELKIVKDIIGDTQNGLEIGIGSGRFAIKPNIVIGIEPSSKMRKIALSKGLNVMNGIAEDLPFKSQTFDFAMMITSICFIKNPKKSLKEAFRVIKDGGFLIIGFIDKKSELGKQYEESKKKSKFYANAKFYSLDELISLCKIAGFNDFKKYENIDSENPMTFLKIYK